MKIKHKLLLAAVCLALLPLALISLLLWHSAARLSGEAIDQQVRKQLSALRDTQIIQVRNEIDGRLAALRTLASSRQTAEALQRLKSGFDNVHREDAAADGAQQQQALLDYLKQGFAAEYARRHPGRAPELGGLVLGLSPQALRLQVDYLARNPHPPAEKSKLQQAPGAAGYHAAHALYHPGFERAQQLLGLRDLFLIDNASDQIVYSVAKGLDFGSRLSDGVAAKSRLADAYQRVKQARDRDDIYFSDFEPYLPAFHEQVAFAAVPVFDGERQVGVLAMQLSIQRLHVAMSADGHWSRIGLGETGDVFIVGSDGLLRSEPRPLLEEGRRSDFLRQLEGRLPPAQLAQLRARPSGIGVLRIDSDETRAAREGHSGTLRHTDFRGVETIAAYGPLQVAGQQWAIVARIDAAEAEAPLRSLSAESLQRSAAVALALLLVVGVLGSVLLGRFVQPIDRLHATIRAVASGQSNARSGLQQRDEIGDLGRAFDQLLDERIATLERAEQENERLNNSVIALLQTVFQLSNRDLTARAEVTEDVIGTLSSSINELTQATGSTLLEVREIAERVRGASDEARQQADHVGATALQERAALQRMADELTKAARQLLKVARQSESSGQAAERAAHATEAALLAVSATVRGMDQLREAIADAEKRFKRLGERSQAISSAVSLIGTIAERTHMLAMNASMQAATAGEAGRGFAVVAEEVQRLSDSSRQATQQIALLVQNIQIEANETLYTMNRLISQVVLQSEQAQQAGDQMTLTQETTTELIEGVRKIAIASDQQSLVARELQVAVAKLNKGSEQTVAAIEEQTRSTQSLVAYSQRLAQAVGQFKLPETV
jgi:methyl-accepting chemotaxis protein